LHNVKRPPLPAISRQMKAYKTFKIITLILFIVGFSFELYLVIDATIAAIDHRSLTGGGRAQSEFFLMGLFFIGRPIGFAGLVLWISNLIVDLIYKGNKINRNELLYIGLTFMTLTPFVLDEVLLNIMYSGWH